MTQFSVGYTTPAATGTAIVEADEGIVAAQAEAQTAVHILTGHPLHAIDILSVTDAEGLVLWVAEDQPIPESWHADMGAT